MLTYITFVARRRARIFGSLRNPFITLLIVIVANAIPYYTRNHLNAAHKVSTADASLFRSHATYRDIYMSYGHHDPRLALAWLLNNITNTVVSHQDLVPDLQLPFSWSSWLARSSIAGDSGPNDSSRCSSLPVDMPLSQENRANLASCYLSTMPVPHRLALLGVGSANSTSVVRLYSAPNFQVYQNLSIHNSTSLLSKALDDYGADKEIFTRITSPNPSLSLSESDFEFDLHSYYSQLKERAITNSLDRVLFENLESLDAFSSDNYPKYFHEALVTKDKRGHHFDWRFFTTLDYTDYERKAIIHRLSRAWLRFASSIGLQTWLAHGTLLGWYWNGMSLPWDSDIDVQLTMKSLLTLARYNQTIVVDLHDHKDYNLGIGSYLVDVGPSYFSRERGNGMNVIDARFIDTATGFYVDITAVSSPKSVHKSLLNHRELKEFNQVLDPSYLDKKDSSTVTPQDLQAQLEQSQHNLLESNQLYHCRNLHYYTYHDLNELKPTLFEGVRAYVPSEYLGILKREYSHGLYSKQHAKHTFRPVLGLWVPSNVCKNDATGKNCKHRETLMEYNATSEYTKWHREHMFKMSGEIEEYPPFRIDPWIVNQWRKEH